ncbi:SDR family NAD(P)-dependent oxidoreductase [Robiginitalea biformata]|uniref:Uncharacterized protein n=1 Tax=Robiginitalea biformata (strain ATCC BAA-864 / DSM 15991 / KCTC 12146 / HTCC2501) TaxID=313596 RepID=A4CMC6_ROBBH|nr:SDR family NAD(P)-dependent oxidoreductase [Robiginitalea biformata]EAR14818.1 hypothetical protein RB2501_10847 [Robiginitalea biformata HTCC2501]
MRNSHEKVGIITGASRGFGLSTAKLLAEIRNYQIIGTSTTGAHSCEHAQFSGFALNLSDPDSIRSFVSEMEGIELDFLVNNAGILLEEWDSTEITQELLRQTFEVNLFGTVALTEGLLPLLRPKAHIINVASDWGSFSGSSSPYQPHYKMSKAALNMYTKVLAERLVDRNIRVSSFDPGWIRTDMGGSQATRNPGEVALELLNLLESDAASGHFWHRGTVRDW